MWVVCVNVCVCVCVCVCLCVLPVCICVYLEPPEELIDKELDVVISEWLSMHYFVQI